MKKETGAQRHARKHIERRAMREALRPKPKFEPNQTFFGKALITDKFGMAWWVDADACTITKAF